MLHWNGHECGDANFNSLSDFDAVVDPSFAANNGQHYTTIAAAIAAGAENIAVAIGQSTESLTITTDNVRIVGLNPTENSTHAACLKKLTIDASYVTVENMLIAGAVGNVVTISGGSREVRMRRVNVISPSTNGFYIEPDQWGVYLDECSVKYAGNGFYIGAPTGSEEMGEIFLSHCRARYNTSAGFRIMSNSTAGTGDVIEAALDHCYAENNVLGASASSGFSIGGNIDATFVGCRSIDNSQGTASATGFYVVAPVSGRALNLTACTSKNNDTGFSLTAASAAVVLLGNKSINDTTGYVNAGSSPGYVTTNTNLTI